MARMKSSNPNPAGRGGKPFSLYPHSFDEVVDKMLSTPPPPKDETKAAIKRSRKRSKVKPNSKGE
jgi:hypothetical protein